MLNTLSTTELQAQSLYDFKNPFIKITTLLI